MTKKPYKQPVARENEARTKYALASLLWMLVGALIAVMVGVFLYLSPLFDSFRQEVDVNPPVTVTPIEQPKQNNNYEFYEVLPNREFRSGQELTVQQQPDDTKDLAVDNVDATVVASTTQVQNAPKSDDMVVVTEENHTYDEPVSGDNPAGVVNITPSNNTYILQIRSYNNPEEADRMRAEVMIAGVDARVVKRIEGGMKIYQVISNTMKSRSEVMNASKRLSDNGIDSVIVEQKHE